MISINGKIWQRVDTSANWASENPILEDKEQGFDSTVKAFKIGDGVTAWNSLGYYYPTANVDPLPITILSSDTNPLNVTSLGAYQNGFTGFSQNIIVAGKKAQTINDVSISYNWTGSVLTSIDITAHQGFDDVLIELF